MELSIKEAATILGRNERTVRDQVARGEIPGRKVGGQWRVLRATLPLNEAQHRALQARAEAVRAAVDDALPPRFTNQRGRRGRALADLEAFRRAMLLEREIRGSTLPEAAEIATQLRDGLCALSEAHYAYDRGMKLGALGRCRAALSRAVARLLLVAPDPAADPVRVWVATMDEGVFPPLAGLFRQAERLGGRA